MPNFFLKQRQGFTIIELLVVLAVIALISSLIFVQMQQARSRARDAEREEEIKTIQSALALYVVSNSLYPVYTGVLTGSDPVSLALVGSNSLSQVPMDPINDGNFKYSYESSNGTAYELTYYLETDSIPGKQSGIQKATP